MGRVLDQAADVGRQELYRISQLYDLPDYVKAASEEDLCGQHLKDHLYGDPSRRLYPCHTKAATILSALFFAENRNHFTTKQADNIERRLASVAKYFGAYNDFDKVSAQVRTQQVDSLSQLPDTEFALIWEYPDGTKERHYPLRNADEVKTAQDWLLRNRDEFVLADRQAMASRILDKSAEFSVPVSDQELYKLAGCGTGAAKDISDALMKRAALLRNRRPEYADQLKTLAAAVEKSATWNRPALRQKLAGIMDEVDQETGLAQHYHNGLPRPEDVCFSVQIKHAKDALAGLVELTNGSVYEKEAIASLPVEAVRDWMGSDFADAVSVGGLFVDAEKAASIIPTLPVPTARDFDRLMEAMQKPAAYSAGRHSGAVGREALIELARG